MNKKLSILDGIIQFQNDKDYNSRYASFDYCYNYFYSFRNNPKELSSNENMQNSCLQLGFYLASWGMMRGSSFLLGKSAKYLESVINIVSNQPSELWSIDLNNYNDDTIQLLINCKADIIMALSKENKPSNTLISKIMLGIFGNVPAYDRNFKYFLKANNLSQSFSKKSLNELHLFYIEHKGVFDSFNINTLHFDHFNKEIIVYPIAKLLDMYGFVYGLNYIKK